MTEEQWNAIKNHDAAYDGIFFYGVTTTKKIMRPSCHCKLAKRENIEIFDTLDKALSNGYQPCKKCCPDSPDWTGVKNELILSVREILRDRFAEKLSLEELAEILFVNKYYLARTFKEVTGITLLDYHNQLRCEKSIEYLHNPDYNLAYISSMIGYSSSSHYINTFKKYYGCTPIEYRKEIVSHERIE